MPYTTYGRHRLANALKGGPLLAATAQATGDTITSTAHGIANNEVVYLTDLVGGAGLTASTPYYVIGTAANTFQVATTPGGSAVDITTNYTSLTVHIGAPTTHVGLGTKGADITSVSAATNDNFTKTTHGLSAGDMVIVSSLVGGVGLTAGDVYYVRTVADANTFTLGKIAGASTTAVDITTAYTSLTVNKITEVSGGTPAYARKPLAYALATDSTDYIDDTTNGAVIDVPASTVDYTVFYSALTGGPAQAVVPQTQEVFATQGTYTVTDAKLGVSG